MPQPRMGSGHILSDPALDSHRPVFLSLRVKNLCALTYKTSKFGAKRLHLGSFVLVHHTIRQSAPGRLPEALESSNLNGHQRRRKRRKAGWLPSALP